MNNYIEKNKITRNVLQISQEAAKKAREAEFNRLRPMGKVKFTSNGMRMKTKLT